MFEIPVFRAEREAGLDAKIRASAAVAIASVARTAESCRLSEQALARLLAAAPQFAKAAQGDFDLHHLTTVLVTVGWNRNDDVFDPVETWVARRTPAHKQLNYEHDDAKIIGHMTDNWVIDADGKAVADDSLVDDLPAKFHVATGSVLYKCWQTPELQRRMDDLLAGIAKGEWFVSMECLFKGFDYALKDRAGAARVVARNDQTAFLSKHLRAYGGTGEYGEYRVGRLLRNIVFSGKGMVRNPANPESVVLTSDPETFSAAAADLPPDFSPPGAGRVYSLPAAHAGTDTQESTRTMTVTVEQLQAQVAEKTTEIEKLKASQTEAVVNDLKAQVAKAAEAAKAAEGEAKKAADELAKAQADLTAKAGEVDGLKAKLADAQKSLDESQAELKGLYAEKTKLTRVALAKDKLGIDDAAADEFVTANAGLTDDAFAKQVEFIAKTVAAKTASNNAQPGNTSFPGPDAKAAPKATDKPTGPKATDKPAPMAGKADVTADDAGAAAAAGTDLETAQPDNQPALSTAVADAGVSDVQKAIAAAFGFKDPEAN